METQQLTRFTLCTYGFYLRNYAIGHNKATETREEECHNTLGDSKFNAFFLFSFRLQSHYRRALALSGLGRIEEAFIAYCASICLDKRSENLTNALRYDLSRVSFEEKKSPRQPTLT